MKRFFGALIAMAVCVSCCFLSVSASENKASVTGKWYAADGSGTEFYFYKDGRLKLSGNGEAVTGKYTLKNGTMEFTLSYEDRTEEASVSAAADGGALMLRTDNTGRISSLFPGGKPLLLSRKKLYPVNQEDIYGTWAVRELYGRTGEKELGIVIFREKGTDEINMDGMISGTAAAKDGKFLSEEELPDNVIIKNNSNVLFSCGGKLYRYREQSLELFEKYEKTILTEEMLKNAYNEKYSGFFRNGKFIFSKKGEKYYYDYALGKSSVTLTGIDSSAAFRYYVTDGYIYFADKNEGMFIFKRRK